MAISGKSSSVAALLMVVAVLAGTCASGADAQGPSAFSITNLCNKTIVLSTGASNNVTLIPGIVQTITKVLFSDLVNITIPGTGTISIPADILTLLGTLLQSPLGLKKIAITCNGPCITLTVTFSIPLLPIALPVGPICLPILPPLPPVPSVAPTPAVAPSPKA
jgi:hypothetical protein